MQVPVGHEIVDGKIIPSDWLEIIWGPIFHVRWVHMLLAASLTTAMCVAATGAWYILRRVPPSEGRVMLHWGLAFSSCRSRFSFSSATSTANTRRSTSHPSLPPSKGAGRPEQPARLILFAWPDPDNERNLFEIAIPVIGSFVDDGNFTAEEPGIITIPKDERPPIAVPFFGFRIMVGMGLVMLAVGWFGNFLRALGRLETTRWFLWCTFFVLPFRLCRCHFRLVHG